MRGRASALLWLEVVMSIVVGVGCREHRSDAPVLAPDLSSALCIGPADAKRFAVYLHGADARSPSEQEISNRKVLSEIATDLSLRIALPRASFSCPNQADSVCWGWSFTDAERAVAVAAIDASAVACFPAGRPFVLIGFSNGGYMLEKLFRLCELPARVPRARSVVTVGSAMFAGALEAEPATLRDCGRLVLLAGTHDELNLDPKASYVRALEAKGASVEQVIFDGGHSVPLEPTRRVLRAVE